MKTTKRIAAIAIAFMCTLAFMPLIPSGIFASGQVHAASKVKYISFSTKPTMESIKVKWKKKKGVKYYVIYKKDVTKKVTPGDTDATVKMSQYKKIKKIKAGKKKFTYTDKKVKKNHYYAYVIKAYKVKNGKKKLAYSSYDNGSLQYDCPGLAAPELLNDGTGEFHSNTNKKFYFWYTNYNGVDPSYVLLYRKAAGEKKYKIIKKVKCKSSTLTDTTVKKGTTYYYKARTRIKYRGKYYYSKYSKVLCIENGNMTGKFTIDIIDDCQEDEYIKKIKLTSDKANGTLTFTKELLYSPEDAVDEESNITIERYSMDGSNWVTDITKPFKLKPGQSIYLNISGKGMKTRTKLECNAYTIDYAAPWNGITEFTFDFSNKKATAVFAPYDD